MLVLPKIIKFIWDQSNLDKSYQKHDVTPKEAEEIFVSEDLQVINDVKHSQDEERFIALGKTFLGKSLFVVFTMRKDKIRIVSARRMHQKEVEKYEKAKKNTTL